MVSVHLVECERMTYRDIVEALANEIAVGKYVKGRALPSVVLLMRRFSVSRATVAKALDELRRRRLVYSRQGSGTFVSSQTKIRIGIVMPGIACSEFFVRILALLMLRAQAAGVELVLGEVFSPDVALRIRQAGDLVDEMIAQSVSGVVYQPVSQAKDRSGVANQVILRRFEDAGIPVVLFDSDIVRFPQRSKYDLVSVDNEAVGAGLACHLQQMGARRIAYFMRPNFGPNVERRLNGVNVVLAATRRGWRQAKRVVAEPGDLRAVRRAFCGKNKPDAVICEADTSAAGLYQSLSALGVTIPGQIMVAGVDDVDLARLLLPALTSMHQPCEMLANAVFDRILARIANPSAPAVTVFLEPKLVVRKSTQGNGKHDKTRTGG